MLALWYPWKSCKDRGVPFDVYSGGAVAVNSSGNEVCETVLLTQDGRVALAHLTLPLKGIPA